MGNMLSIPLHDDSDTSHDGASSEDSISTLASADDLDFAAAEIILTMNSSHLDAVVRGKVASDTNPATDLVHDISTAIQDGAAADKHARIADVDAESGADAESVRRSVSAFYLTIAKVLSAISLAIQPENEPPADPAETDNLFSPDFKMSLNVCLISAGRIQSSIVLGRYFSTHK